MPFLVLTFDKPGHGHIRDEHRQDHYAHLQAHLPKLLASGGLRDDADKEFIGGAILFDAATREEAELFAATDPFTKAGLFERVEIVRWKPAFLLGNRVNMDAPAGGPER